MWAIFALSHPLHSFSACGWGKSLAKVTISVSRHRSHWPWFRIMMYVSLAGCPCGDHWLLIGTEIGSIRFKILMYLWVDPLSTRKNLPPQLLMILEEAGHLDNLNGKKRSQNHAFDSFLLMLSIGLNLAGKEPLIFQIQILTIFESNPRPKGRFWRSTMIFPPSSRP